MILLKRLSIVSVLASSSVSLFAAVDSGCEAKFDKFRGLAEKAGQQEQYVDALRWQRKAVEGCPSYKNYQLLGVFAKSAKDWDTSLSAYEKAQGLAENGDDQAVLIGRYSEVLLAKGNYQVEALSLLQAARKIHSDPPAWMNELAMQLDQSIADKPLTKDVITRGLGSVSDWDMLSVQDIQVKPNKFVSQIDRSMDVKLNFLSNSTEMDARSQANMRALADTLADPAYADKTIWLVGHSDVRGEGQYNWQLSERRAHAAYNALVAMQPSLANKIKSKGMGESSPLYNGEDDSVHRLNRRLEIILE